MSSYLSSPNYYNTSPSNDDGDDRDSCSLSSSFSKMLSPSKDISLLEIKSFITATSEYLANRNDTLESIIQKHLEAIKITNDLSIFDPHSCTSTEFYVSLFNLMNVLESRNNLIWAAIDVLQIVCKNDTARKVLINTYKYIPILVRHLEANITLEKRIRILKLLQELTYGIKIYWLEPHLLNLLKTLSQWVTQSSEAEEITLSLGVLVNLCYKNLPVVYLLMRTINTKTFIRSVVKTNSQNVNIRVQCCKLLIILEHTSCDILDCYILDVATVTLKNIIPALNNKDNLLLRHMVDFFEDIRQNERFKAVLHQYENYVQDVQKILSVTQSITNSDSIGFIMEFLISLVKLQAPVLVPIYPMFVKIAMSKMDEQVYAKSLTLIRIVISDAKRTLNYTEIMEEIDLEKLMIIMSNTENFTDIDQNSSLVQNKQQNLSELMQLLQELVKMPAIRTDVLKIFPVETMYNLLQPLLQPQDNWKSLIGKPYNLLKDTFNDFYIYALALTSNLAANNSDWITLYNELLEKKQFQIIIAVKLFTGDYEVKQKILQIIASIGFPQECIAAVSNYLCEIQIPTFNTEISNMNPDVTSNNSLNSTMSCHINETLPFFSLAQEERLEILLNQLENSYKSNKFSDITTSSIIELYEYKLATMRNAHKATQINLESSSKFANDLQHRMAETIAQSTQLQQILLNTQQCLEGMQAEKLALSKRISDIEEETKIAHNSKIMEITALKKIILEREQQLLNANEQIKEFKSKIEEIPVLKVIVKEKENEIDKIKSKLDEADNKINKMQDLLNKKDQIIEEKVKEISSCQKDIKALNQEMQQQVQQCHSFQKKINEKDEMVEKLKTELTELSRMRDMIFQLTNKK